MTFIELALVTFIDSAYFLAKIRLIQLVGAHSNIRWWGGGEEGNTGFLDFFAIPPPQGRKILYGNFLSKIFVDVLPFLL